MQLQEEMQAVPPQPLVDPEGALEGLEELAPGTVVNGFRLVRQVGKGGFGNVWLAVSVHKRVHKPGRHYALKFSLASVEEDDRAVREVQLLLQVAHPHVLRVLGYGRWPDPERGIHYTVLEWVDGGTLLEWARKANPSLRQAVRLAQQLARAVQAVHERGVVHRDIKPANVLVSAEHGTPLLADFGLGKTAGSPPLTPAGLPVGTHAYRSPEALASSLRAGGAPYHFQPADDWYALGVTLYELLTEVRPFPEAEESAEHARNVARLRPVPPHVLNPRVPLALSRVVLRLLEKKPSWRYRDGNALWAALDSVLAQEGAWDESVYPPGAPQEPRLTPSRYPTQLDEALAAQDVELAWAYACKHDDPPEEYREGRAVRLRNALLAAQPRPWPQALRLLRWGVAALVLVLAAAGVWAAWEPDKAAHSPANMPSPVSLPPAAPAPQPSTQTPPPVPVASPAPEAVAEAPPQPSVALMSATSQKEDSAVKTPQSPPPSQPVSISNSKRALKPSRLGPACAAGLIVAGCPGIPVRPPPKECPPAAINSMEALKLEPGSSYAAVQIDVKGPPPENYPNITFREGPVVSRVIDIGGPESDYLPVGSLLFGKVIPGGGDHFFIRYEEAQPAGSTERVPVCAIARDPYHPSIAGMPKKEGSTDTEWNSYNGTSVKFVKSFSEADKQTR